MHQKKGGSRAHHEVQGGEKSVGLPAGRPGVASASRKSVAMVESERFHPGAGRDTRGLGDPGSEDKAADPEQDEVPLAAPRQHEAPDQPHAEGDHSEASRQTHSVAAMAPSHRQAEAEGLEGPRLRGQVQGLRLPWFAKLLLQVAHSEWLRVEGAHEGQEHDTDGISQKL